MFPICSDNITLTNYFGFQGFFANAKQNRKKKNCGRENQMEKQTLGRNQKRTKEGIVGDELWH